MSHSDELRKLALGASLASQPEKAAAARAGAEALDTLEYRVEHQHIENGSWHPVTQWSPEWPLNEGHSVASDERIVCRRVSEPWEVTNE